MPKLLCIVNPVSGRGRSKRVLPALLEHLHKAGHQTRVEMTLRAGHAADLIHGPAGQWANGIISVGGDGTFNEVLNAHDTNSNKPLGMIPLGTGNAIAKELGFWNNMREAFDCIARWETLRLDHGEIGTGRRFTLMLSAGFDAQIIQRLAEDRHGTMRMSDYLPLILRESRKMPDYRMRLWVDEIERGTFSYINCANFRSCGGPIEFASHACPSDGLFEVVTFDRSLKRAMPMLVIGAALKQFSRIPGVQRFRGHSLRIEPTGEQAVPIQIDGEYAGALPISLVTRQRALRIFCPRRMHSALLEQQY